MKDKDIINFLRDKAVKYDRMADFLEYEQADSVQVQIEPRTEPLTACELEKAVDEKAGRVRDLMFRLNVTRKEIEDLLEPNSRVYVDNNRGWLKVRTPQPENNQLTSCPPQP